MRIRAALIPSLLVASTLIVTGCSGSSSDASAGTSRSTPTTVEVTASSTTLPKTTEVAGSQLKGDVAFLGPIRTVKVGKNRLAFRQFGKGPDLVLIAGQASPMSLWPATTFLAPLAKDHRVTIYDNRDLGGSSNSGDFTLSDLADDGAGLIAALGLHKPAVFGWSTGGEIGLLLAIRHPGSIGSLATTGATPGGPKSVLAPEKVNALFADPTPDTNALFDVLFSPSGAKAKDAFLKDYVRVPQGDVSPAATASYDKAERAYWAAPEPDLASIDVPVLVMNGSADYAVPPANATYIASRIGHGTKVELDDGGRHAWFLEHPDHFLQALATFLKQ